MVPASFAPVLLTRAPADGREDLAAYQAAGGYAALRQALRELKPDDVVRLVEEAELRGRGGAGFLTSRKWEIACLADALEKHVVANGGEHEPGSHKDRTLLTLRPHLVIEGATLAAYATGSRTAWIYVIEDMHDAITAVESSIHELRDAGLIGQDVLGSGFNVNVRLVRAPTTYVAGEETAALEVIEGRKALPRKKPPYPGEQGLFKMPTTVNNVETLANVPGIVRNGAEWFRGIGAPGSAGSMLFTLGPEVRSPGVYELPFGATIRDLVEGKGGGLVSGAAIKGILPALSCAWLPGTALDTPLTHEAFRLAGTTLGCGGVSLLAADSCAVERTLEIARFFAREQCGQCPPCRMETNTMSSVLERTAEGDPGDYAAAIAKVAAFAARKGYCSLIEMAAAPVLSALRLFPADFAHHAASGRCPA